MVDDRELLEFSASVCSGDIPTGPFYGAGELKNHDPYTPKRFYDASVARGLLNVCLFVGIANALQRMSPCF